MSTKDTRPVAPAGVNTKITTTRTNLDNLRSALESWLRRATNDASLAVYDLDRSTTSGMSSVSILFTAEHGDRVGRHDQDEAVGHPDDPVSQASGRDQKNRTEYVLRLAPESSALPVFEDYDLRHQAAVANAIADTGQVPVPRVRWVETSSEPLGRPFLIMDRAYGQAPPDNPPYVFEGPLTEASSRQLAHLQRESVDLLAKVHATPNPASIAGMPSSTDGITDIHRFLNETQSYYEWTITDGGLRIPLLEYGLAKLWEAVPESASGSVLTWGDARIGNIMYRNFHPQAALDWEGATLAPPELDAAWFIFFHRMYQDMAESFGKSGLPNFLRAQDVITQYQHSSNRSLQDMEFYLVLSAVRMGVIFARIKARTVSFGDTPAPATPDEYVLHHRMLRAVIDDEYDWRI